jgi:hypothetical protein
VRRNQDLLEPQSRGAKPLLNSSTNEEVIWEHFVYYGQFEPRQYR